MYRIEQGILKSYDDNNPRVCNVLQIPDGYVMSSIRLPNTLSSQTKPKEESLVLVAMSDSYKGFLLSHLRDPAEFLANGEGTRGVSEEFGDDLAPGEVYFEAAGDPEVPVSGTGGSLHLANDGTITLSSGKLKEFISIGGEKGDDDGDIILNADNVILRSNMLEGETIESTIKFSKESLVEIGNYFKPFPIGDSIIPIPPIPLGELTIDQKLFPVPGTEITLRNQTLAGTPLNSLVMSPSGVTTFTSLLSMNLDATTTISLNSTLGMTLDGLTINLNSGTFGVARLNDIVTSDVTTDPTWWAFWGALSTAIGALPTSPSDGGATLKAGLAGLFASVPVTVISKITTASITVKAG